MRNEFITAKSCVVLLLFSLGKEELSIKHVDTIIGHVMRNKQSFPLLKLANCIIDVTLYLAYKPLKRSDLKLDVEDYVGKFTAISLRNNLPDIIKECYVLKV